MVEARMNTEEASEESSRLWDRARIYLSWLHRNSEVGILCLELKTALSLP